MKQNEFHELVIRELSGIKEDIKQVRQSDIPAVKTDVAVLRERLDTKIQDLEKKTSWSNRCYTVLGGALAVLIAKFTGGTH